VGGVAELVKALGEEGREPRGRPVTTSLPLAAPASTAGR